MKVCYLIPRLDYATGYGRWTIDLLENITCFDIKPILILPKSYKNVYEQSSLKKHKAYFCGPEPFGCFQHIKGLNLEALRDLYVFVKSLKFIDKEIDIVHSVDVYPWGYFGLKLKKFLKVPLVLTAHGPFLFRLRINIFDKWLCKRVLTAADCICPVSNAVKKYICFHYKDIDEKNFYIIHNGINLSRWRPINKFKVCNFKNPIILSVTRFIPLKGIEIGIKAFKLVKTIFPSAKYYIIGPKTVKKYVKKIKNLIHFYSLEKDVILIGKVDSVEKLSNYYQKADVFVHTPRWEGFSLVLLEASIFGLPIVATRVGGITEVLIHGKTGILVDVDNVVGIAQAIIRILQDKKLAQQISEGAQNAVMQFDVRKVARKYYNLYKHLLIRH